MGPVFANSGAYTITGGVTLDNGHLIDGRNAYIRSDIFLFRPDHSRTSCLIVYIAFPHWVSTVALGIHRLQRSDALNFLIGPRYRFFALSWQDHILGYRFRETIGSATRAYRFEFDDLAARSSIFICDSSSSFSILSVKIGGICFFGTYSVLKCLIKRRITSLVWDRQIEVAAIVDPWKFPLFRSPIRDRRNYDQCT